MPLETSPVNGSIAISPSGAPLRVGYVVKRYPRYSETFIVNEILAHEAQGLEMVIFALGFPAESHFQDTVSQVRSPVHYLMGEVIRAFEYWNALCAAAQVLPEFWPRLDAAVGEEARDVYQAALLARQVHDRGITHLHAHFATSSATVARLAAHFAGVSFSMTAHAKDIFHEDVDDSDLRRKIEEAAATTTVSDYNLRFLRDKFGTDSRVHRIYNGMHLEKFSFQEPRQREPLLMAVGRLVEKKGFADLVHACAILAKRGCTFRCRILGEGEQEAALRGLIEQLGLQGYVELSGPRPQNKVIGEVQQAAVFVAPCVVGRDGNRDGLPTVLLEAMALGTPCVSTNVTGIPEVVRHNETGLIVPQHDPNALADACEKLLDDEELRIRLAAQARQLIEEQFDIQRNSACLRALFHEAQREAKNL